MNPYTYEDVRNIASKVVASGWKEISVVVTDTEVRCTIYKQYGVMDQVNLSRSKDGNIA